MRTDVDYEMPTIIRCAVYPGTPIYGPFYALLARRTRHRTRFARLFVEFVERVTSGELVWR